MSILLVGGIEKLDGNFGRPLKYFNAEAAARTCIASINKYHHHKAKINETTKKLIHLSQKGNSICCRRSI